MEPLLGWSGVGIDYWQSSPKASKRPHASGHIKTCTSFPHRNAEQGVYFSKTVHLFPRIEACEL